MVYLTDETFTYVINGADRDFNLGVPGGNYQDLAKYKNILLSEDFGIHMGSHLDSSVREYYCEVIQYTYSNYNDAGASTEPSNENINFTQLYSNLNELGMRPKHLAVNKATYPLTQMSSTKNNTGHNDEYNGITRNTVLQRQNNTFVCSNFNQMVKYFRMASLRYGSNYGFTQISSMALVESYGNSSLVYPYTINLTGVVGATGGAWAQQYWLKNYPVVIMYMTPIYYDKVPRILRVDDCITLQISSVERISGENGFGADCIVRINPINSKYKKFKAVFQSLDVMGGLSVSKHNRVLCNFSFNFLCYDWNKTKYGYGGDKKGNGTILTSMPMTFNYQDPTRTAKLTSNIGSVIDINNELHNKDIRFNFLCSQMHKPETSTIVGTYNDNGFLNDGLTAGQYVGWEWILTMRLYGVE